MDKFVVIDIETTGHSPQTSDRMIEVGIVVIEDEQITNDFSTLLNPNKSIPPFITNLTGITDEDVVTAPNFSEKAHEIIDLFKNSYLVAHNVDFDLGFLNEELALHELPILSPPVIDTVELARILYPQAPGYQLGQLAEYLKIIHRDPHRALSDAYVTAELFLNLKEKLRSLPYETVVHLLNLEKNLHSDLDQLLSKQRDHTEFTATECHDVVSFRGLAFKNKQMTWTESTPINTSFGDLLDQVYEAHGALEKTMKDYEERPGQRTMSETIYDAFQSQNHTLIEAETGTGKSLAYLIPAIYEAIRTKDRIVISTYTTQLQTQLMEEEIPIIREFIDHPFRIALLKGKSHYISLERFKHELENNPHDNYDIALTKAMLLIWLTETETGDIDEIQLPASGYYFFNIISTDSESNIDPNSAWFSHSFYQRARRRAQQADVIITNHALLCTDLLNEYKFIPSYKKVIVDEAHHFETTVSRHYGLQLDYVNIKYALNQIGLTNDGNWLQRILKRYPAMKQKIPVYEWDTAFHNMNYENNEFFRLLFQYVLDQQSKKHVLSDTGRVQYRFIEEKEDLQSWSVIKEMAGRIIHHMEDLIHFLIKIEHDLSQLDLPDKYEQDNLARHLEKLQSFVERMEQLFLNNADTSTVKWIEIEAYGAKNAVYIYAEPTDVSSLLANDFFDKMQSVVLTSATLTMRNSFSFIEKRLGLVENEVVSKQIESPFTYEDQVQLLIPNDFPDINEHVDDFIYSTCEAIISLAEVTDGRMLVLFTSYDMLRKSHAILRETLDVDKYMLIAQGISSGSRTRLKKNFQSFDQAILLGTSSFWEGVDIPGDDLSSLVIVRLPFQPPNHPIYEAKSAAIHEEGKNAFIELALPDAVIRFKQGFGRLIRSTNDRGIVFVCDARMIEARYGKFFTESIPNVPITYDSMYQLINKAEDWF